MQNTPELVVVFHVRYVLLIRSFEKKFWITLVNDLRIVLDPSIVNGVIVILELAWIKHVDLGIIINPANFQRLN